MRLAPTNPLAHWRLWPLIRKGLAHAAIRHDVLVGSAAIHAEVWRETFDDFISRRAPTVSTRDAGSLHVSLSSSPTNSVACARKHSGQTAWRTKRGSTYIPTTALQSGRASALSRSRSAAELGDLQQYGQLLTTREVWR